MLDSCKMLQKYSEAFHTFLWHFSKFKTEFYCISFFYSAQTSELYFEIHQLWQLGFSTLLIIPIPAVAVHLNLKS